MLTNNAIQSLTYTRVNFNTNWPQLISMVTLHCDSFITPLSGSTGKKQIIYTRQLFIV